MVKQKLNSLILIIMPIVVYSCINQTKVYNHTEDIVELGNNYYYLADGKESQILLNLKPQAKSKFGKTIIPPEVIQYNYDKNFIIAETIDRANGKESNKYWIVEKATASQDPMPLDSMGFYEKIDILQIKMKLEQRK